MRAIQFLTPHHDNIGDNAQAYCIYNMLTSYFGIDNVVSFQLPDTDKGLEQIQSTDIIFLGSGGYLGDLWIRGELCRREIIKKCKDNIIVSFPQTVSFSSANEIKISADIYKEHPRLFLFTRDPESYVLAKTYFPTNNIFQLPDPVFTLSHNNTNERKGILCIFRDDKEDAIKENKLSIINKCLEFNSKVDVIDTERKEGIVRAPIPNIDKNLPEFLDKISKYELVVTDRFHGTIFAGITGTPCIAFPTINHKIVSSVYWYKNLNTKLSICKDIESFPEYLQEIHKPFIYNPSKAISLYHQVISSILHTETISNLNPVEEAIQHRRTIRKWRPVKIPNNILSDIVQSGVNAPTGANAQCIRFKIITDKTLLQAIANKHKYKSNFPPAIIFVGYDFNVPGTVNFEHKNSLWEPLKFQDIAASIQNMLLYCESIGLSCCWLSYFIDDMQWFLNSINIKDSHIEYLSAIAVGVADPSFKEVTHNELNINRKSLDYYVR